MRTSNDFSIMKSVLKSVLKSLRSPLLYTAFTGISFFAFSQPSEASWEANDVSVLLPLPPAKEISELLGPESKGPKGSLLSRDVFDLFPDLVRFVDREVVFKENLKVVSIRLDPCFIEGAGPYKCRRQIRMVWQPVVSAGKAATTLDASLHTFYDFSDAEWAQVLDDWKTLPRTANVGEALDLQPEISQEGYSSPYWKSLETVLLQHCGEKNLTRASAMVLNGPLMWIFLGFDLSCRPEGFISSKLPIARIGTGAAQSFVMDMESLAKLEEFQARVAPKPQETTAWTEFILDSLGFRLSKSEDEIKTVINRAFQFENPTTFNAGTLDCVSCHTAHTARVWGERNMTQWNWPGDFSGSRFQSARNLANRSVGPLQTNRLRAFGYFEDEAQISQRVINETATVLDTMDREFPR